MNHNKVIYYAVGAALLIVGVGFLAIKFVPWESLGSLWEGRESSSTAEDSETFEEALYENADYGFSFTYPFAYTPSESKDKGKMELFPKQVARFKKQILKLFLEQLSLTY